ncbi:MAG: hypothetical protein AAF602_05205, partial [Myxococcota bacterium]
PEDLDALPDGRHVLVSEYGDLNGEIPGTLALLDLETDARIVAFDGATDLEPVWGDPACPGAPGAVFSPHGLHVSQRPDGVWQALVVNHGGRESIEFFEIADGPELAWRGCVVAPERSLLNDVVATPEGGFLTTQMMPKRKGLGPLFAYLGAKWFDRGAHVWSWDPSTGFAIVAGTEGGLANGLALADDGRTLFVAYSLSGELRRVDRTTGEIEDYVMMDPIDNLTWTGDGWLVAATALAEPSIMRKCVGLEEGTCPGAHAIVAVEPTTLEQHTVYVGGPGTPGGAGTTGLVLDDGTLLIGTFAGDRIVRVSSAW